MRRELLIAALLGLLAGPALADDCVGGNCPAKRPARLAAAVTAGPVVAPDRGAAFSEPLAFEWHQPLRSLARAAAAPLRLLGGKLGRGCRHCGR